MRIAILDDYLRVALRMADWSALQRRCEIEVFDRPLAVPEEAARALASFDILCTLRERMAVPRALIERLPKLKFLAITGLVHRTLDLAAATERGILVSHTEVRGSMGRSTSELAWGLILALARYIPQETQHMRTGGWQSTVGHSLYGKTLGILGPGKLGANTALVGRAFGMDVIAWSQNFTDARAAEIGVRRVDKDTLFRESDVLSIHLVLGERTRGIVSARELGLMKRTAFLVNTARGPIVDETALIAALRARAITGAALDVYDREPLSDDHPLRRLDNVLLTPHLGYCTEESYRAFYGDSIENIAAYLDGKPVRLANPEALAASRVAGATSAPA